MKGYLFFQKNFAVLVVLAIIILVSAITPSSVFHTVEAASADEWTVPMVADAGVEGSNADLEFGIHPDATDGYDYGIDLPSPPPSPAPLFEAYFSIVDPLFTSLIKDFRGEIPNEWTLEVKSTDEYIELTWDATDIPAELCALMDTGTWGEINMKAQDSVVLTAGEYTITISVVVDTTPPVITLLGDNPMTVECGDTYVEPGATASDGCCITDEVAIGGDFVDTGTVDTYYVTYDVSDCAGNPAVQVIRTVNVVDTTAPTITLHGDNPMTVECGDDYVEPGATASDGCCITDEITIGGDSVDPGTVGTYSVTYDVSDCAGNPADQVVRTVNVVDTTAPTITLNGDNPMTVQRGDPYVEPGATVSDSCCITDPVTIGGDTVDTSTVGTYYVTYDVSDCAGNPAVQVVRTVNVVEPDTTPPVITLNGDNPMTVECCDPYVEPGATATDETCITEEVIIGGDIVDTCTVGTYNVTYDVSDCAGNPADQVTRIVNVVDTTAPTITLLGDNPMTVKRGDPYVEPGATASDVCCITDEVTIGGDFVDTSTPGTYNVTYDVSDCAGNQADQVVRTVNVVDTTAPVITLIGDNPMTVQRGDPYVEPGATVSDSCCITEEVFIGGDIVDTSTVGTYYVTYDVSDCAGNPAVQVIRTVNVVPTTMPPPTMRCTPKYFFFVASEDGENPQSRTLTIRNFGAWGCAPLEWTVSDNADWLTLSPTSGTTMRTIWGDQVGVSVDTSNMSAGVYAAWITIEAPGATNTPQQVLVILIIRGHFLPFP